MLRSALILALVCGGAACTATAQRGPTTAAGSTANKPAGSARSVLVAYLNATYGGFHARGYSLLTRGDQSRMSRTSYLEEQRNLSAMRTQVEALGKARRKIGKVTERDDRATATVVMTTGLGSERLRFVLRRERGAWRVDYASSWTSP